MRLIDADALDEKLDALMKRYAAQGRKQVAEDYNFVRTVLMTAPTIPNIEAVEVVRCKDCKHYDAHGCLICAMHSLKESEDASGANIYMMPDDFCSYGERSGGADMRGDGDETD